jgi:hypothetical protein
MVVRERTTSPRLREVVSRGTDLIQAPPRGWGLWTGGQGTLASRLSRGVDIDDHQAPPPSIRQPADLLLREPVLEALVLKERSQRPHAGLLHIGEKTAQCRAVRQLLAAKERHEGIGKGRQAFEKGGEGRFGTDGIAKEHRDKIDHLVVPSPSTGEVNLFTHRIKDSTLCQVVGEQGDFRKPGGK